jgi:hypothetical protein
MKEKVLFEDKKEENNFSWGNFDDKNNDQHPENKVDSEDEGKEVGWWDWGSSAS